MLDPGHGWIGFADSSPSESIQNHMYSALATAVVFAWAPTRNPTEPPVTQYKEYPTDKKADRARRLARWLRSQKMLGLKLAGFVNVHVQKDVAVYGLEMIEELPDTSVERHYGGYRLFFGEYHIDFAHAVALQYYVSTVSFGALRAAYHLPPGSRKLFVAMDRFQGASISHVKPGEPVPLTPGHKFVDFWRAQSNTGRGIAGDNKASDIQIQVGSLDWWWKNSDQSWKPGKSHPHFVFPDWLAQAAIANAFPDAFAEAFESARIGRETSEALADLYECFKAFDIWSLGDEVLQHLRASKKLWCVPDDARSYILSRTKCL